MKFEITPTTPAVTRYPSCLLWAWKGWVYKIRQQERRTYHSFNDCRNPTTENSNNSNQSPNNLNLNMSPSSPTESTATLVDGKLNAADAKVGDKGSSGVYNLSKFHNSWNLSGHISGYPEDKKGVSTSNESVNDAKGPSMSSLLHLWLSQPVNLSRSLQRLRARKTRSQQTCLAALLLLMRLRREDGVLPQLAVLDLDRWWNTVTPTKAIRKGCKLGSILFR